MTLTLINEEVQEYLNMQHKIDTLSEEVCRLERLEQDYNLLIIKQGLADSATKVVKSEPCTLEDLRASYLRSKDSYFQTKVMYEEAYKGNNVVKSTPEDYTDNIQFPFLNPSLNSRS